MFFVHWKYSRACETNSHRILLSFIVTLYYLSSTIVQHLLPTNGHMRSVLNCALFVTWNTWKTYLLKTINKTCCISSLQCCQFSMIWKWLSLGASDMSRIIFPQYTTLYIFLMYCYILLNSNICHDVGNINLVSHSGFITYDKADVFYEAKTLCHILFIIVLDISTVFSLFVKSLNHFIAIVSVRRVA